MRKTILFSSFFLNFVLILFFELLLAGVCIRCEIAWFECYGVGTF